MCKKFFHPGSRDNLKRVWMAEQQTEANKKKQEELRLQYEKEQDLYNNKSMLSKESKEKLSVNFMYEPPPGLKREREKEAGEPEFKFEWQRKFNAPRESYCKGDEDVRDQPFGIQVRNVRCIKCHKWGHINTDRECSLYGQAAEMNGVEMDPLLLMHKMREEGLALKQSVLGVRQNEPGHNQELVEGDSSSEEEVDEADFASKVDETGDSELDFLKSLTAEQKLKLLKKLEKLEKKKSSSSKKSKKKDKEKDKKRKHRDHSRTSREREKLKSKAKKSRKRERSSSSSNDSSDSDRPTDRKRMKSNHKSHSSSSDHHHSSSKPSSSHRKSKK